MERYLKTTLNIIKPFVIVLFSVTITYIFFELLLFAAQAKHGSILTPLK